MKEIRDPVHGFINRTSVQEKIINTGIFQRLRKIKQLALASLVYPGALHTRFEHSIGVLHLADKLSKQLLTNADPEEVRLVSLAALLHDIGHGPFSHVSESILEKFYDKAKIQAKSTDKIHELLTCSLIKYSPELARLISEDDRDHITGLLSGTWGERLHKDIVSGPLDADKMDYLLRDSYFCGVKYGVYDIERLLSTFEKLGVNNDAEVVIAVTGDGIHSLEQFVLAKYYMTTQVYRHKIRLITDAMITRALTLGIEVDEIDYLRKLYSFDNTEGHLNDWLRWNDEVLTTTICSDKTKDGYAKQLFTDISNRKLFKRIFHERLNVFLPITRKDLLDNFSKHRVALESEVAKLIDGDPHLVIAHRYKIQSVREQSRNSEGSILVIRDDGSPVPFEEESTLFRSIDEAQKDEYLDFYAPVTFPDEKHKRNLMKTYRENILKIVEEEFKGEP